MDTSAFDRSNCPTLRIAWSERVPLMRQVGTLDTIAYDRKTWL